MKVLELKGYKSLRALNAYSTLVLGVKMLPAYQGETYESFLERVEGMPPEDQAKVFRQASTFVELERDEVEALVSFACDPNGVPYTPVNMKDMSPDRLVEIIVAVCMEISKIKIDLVTESQKKKSVDSQST